MILYLFIRPDHISLYGNRFHLKVMEVSTINQSKRRWYGRIIYWIKPTDTSTFIFNTWTQNFVCVTQITLMFQDWHLFRLSILWIQEILGLASSKVILLSPLQWYSLLNGHGFNVSKTDVKSTLGPSVLRKFSPRTKRKKGHHFPYYYH